MNKKPGPPKGYKHTIEARLKMRGQKRSPETIARMKVAQAFRRFDERAIKITGVL